MKITKETTLAEILKIKGAEEVLAEFELPCLHCPFAKMEMEELEIGKVAENYGLDLEKILEGLNNLKGRNN